MLFVVKICFSSGLILLGLPNSSPQRLADAESDANGNTNDEENDENLQDDPSALAVAGHALAGAVLDLAGLGLLSPMLLARPDGAIGIVSLLAGASLLEVELVR